MNITMLIERVLRVTHSGKAKNYSHYTFELTTMILITKTISSKIAMIKSLNQQTNSLRALKNKRDCAYFKNKTSR